MTLGRLIIVAVILGAGYLVYVNSSEEERQPIKAAVEGAAEVDPLTKGHSAFQLAHYDKALPNYKQVLTEKPDHAERELLMFRIALCYEKIREYNKAADAYQAYLKAYPRGQFAEEAKEKYDRTNLQR